MPKLSYTTANTVLVNKHAVEIPERFIGLKEQYEEIIALMAERNDMIMECWEAGAEVTDLALGFNLSKTAIYQILAKVRQRRAAGY